MCLTVYMCVCVHMFEFKAFKKVYDAGFPSGYCEYHQLIKKLPWPDRVELREAGKTKLNAGKKKGKVRKKPCNPAGNREQNFP